uniref:Uncharacterized protein n=1 Tax=Eutreptiella gymnastica TaxID=73025 RepID=A0A7S4CTR1_9EUGL
MRAQNEGNSVGAAQLPGLRQQSRPAHKAILWQPRRHCARSAIILQFPHGRQRTHTPFVRGPHLRQCSARSRAPMPSRALHASLRALQIRALSKRPKSVDQTPNSKEHMPLGSCQHNTVPALLECATGHR